MIKNPVYVKTNPEYIYVGEVADWTDGDTVKVDIWIFLDFGFEDYQSNLKKKTFRLTGIDTPERGKPGYKEATAFNEENFPVGTEIRVKTYKMSSGYNSGEKYGRYLADIYSVDMEFNLNEALVASGLAVHYDGGTKKLTTA
jgi:micrococcal nuclease